MNGAIAAGHPLSAEIGAAVLADGGNAVDACIAAAFAAAVAEGPLTGPTGGGFLLVAEPGRDPTVLDCFFAMPAEPLGELEETLIDFADSGTQSFSVGLGSVAVPGLVHGLWEAHRRYATVPWDELVEPAIALARTGFEPDAPRAFLYGILTGILLRDEGGRRVYGDARHVSCEDLVPTLELVRDRGPEAVAELLPELAVDLATYRVVERVPLEADVRGARVLTTPSPSRGGRIVLDILGALATRERPSLDETAEAVALAYGTPALGKLTGTTHISALDASGTAAALSSTLGSGSGVFRGGTQLNNMLGELDVIGDHVPEPGERLASMMTPTLVVDDAGSARLVLGSAGSVRLAGAIAQVVWRVLEGEAVSAAIDAPRLHVDGRTLHLEGGFSTDSVAQSWEVVRWAGLNLFFGGVQAVSRSPDGALAAAGDPRRGGAGVVVT
jgi:gamma-glutamyltranspeptidase/glutathione hydrolase